MTFRGCGRDDGLGLCGLSRLVSFGGGIRTFTNPGGSLVPERAFFLFSSSMSLLIAALLSFRLFFVVRLGTGVFLPIAR